MKLALRGTDAIGAGRRRRRKAIASAQLPSVEFGGRPSIWERIPAWISVPFFVLVLVFIWQVLVWLEV